MQIVINISDKAYSKIKEFPENITLYCITKHLYDAVRNGTPLPKGHGRLIDGDRIYDDVESIGYSFEDAIENALTIVEADKED